MKSKLEIIGIWIVCLLCLFPVLSYGEGQDILMFLWDGETQAEIGFRDVLDEAFIDQNINFTVLNVFKDLDRLEALVAETDEKGFDLIYTYGSRITSKVKESYTQTPIVFNIVYDPVRYKIIESWDIKQPNLTGASNSIPLDIQIRKIQEVFGKGNIGFIYAPSDLKALALKEEMEGILVREGLDLLGFEYNKNFRFLRSYLDRVKNQVRCIYMPSGWVISKDIKRIISQINRQKIPTCVTSKTYLQERALLCISVEYDDVGRMAGELAVQILKGVKPADLVVRRPSESDVKLYINSGTLKRLKIQLSRDLELTYIK
ncbi:MAG: ABC transporter substrate-binding protein [bacterium]